MALRRFIARRGQPATIHSDRGTNFVGANQEMKDAWENLILHPSEEEAPTKGIK
jgi:hypothetical protein